MTIRYLVNLRRMIWFSVWATSLRILLPKASSSNLLHTATTHLYSSQVNRILHLLSPEVNNLPPTFRLPSRTKATLCSNPSIATCSLSLSSTQGSKYHLPMDSQASRCHLPMDNLVNRCHLPTDSLDNRCHLHMDTSSLLKTLVRI